MLFVPSVEQGTLAQRGDELARFIREDTGLILQTEVPTSYAAVIQALGAEQADVAWMPAFAYVIANDRYGAEAQDAGGSLGGPLRHRGDPQGRGPAGDDGRSAGAARSRCRRRWSRSCASAW